jgi:AcrR family transcriptional regulator
MSLRAQKKEKARADILSAATRIIQRRGFDETTMREIADAAHVSHQTLYNYFPGKASMFRALLAQQTSPIVEKLTRIADDPGPDLLAALHRGISVTFDYLRRSDRRIWREIVAHAFHAAPEHVGFFATFYDGAQGRLERIIEASRRRGQLRAGTDTRLLAETVYAVVDFAFLSFVIQSDAPPRATLTRVRDQVSLIVTPYLSTSRRRASPARSRQRGP